MAAPHSTLSQRDQRAVNKALRILERSAQHSDSPQFTQSSAIVDYLRCRLGALQREEFHACWLTVSHQLLAIETLFVGTLASTSVYPREVVKSALRHNAGAVIVAHNHPGGFPKPSPADIYLTKALQEALAIVDVKLLDHIIVTAASGVSLRELGLMP